MDKKELQWLVKYAKKQGILRISYSGVELSFSESALMKRKYKEKPTATSIQEEKDERMKALLWSVPDIDPIGDIG